MSLFHTSLKRLLSGATLSGFLSAEGSPQPRPASLQIKRLEKSAGPHDWTFQVALQAAGNTEECPLTADVHWAGSTPVISIHEVNIPGVGTVSAKLLINNWLFAGIWVHNDKRGQVWGEVSPHPRNPPRPRIASSSNAAASSCGNGGRVSGWSDDCAQAQWFEHEPDGPRVTADEGAHAVCYPSGEVEPG